MNFIISNIVDVSSVNDVSLQDIITNQNNFAGKEEIFFLATFAHIMYINSNLCILTKYKGEISC